MVNTKQIKLTEKGLEALELELEGLKTVKRKEIAEKIKIARDFGDLSENSEYDEAMNEQAQVETRIHDIEVMLKNAKIIDEDDVDTRYVSVGTRVKVFDIEFDEEVEYTIVGTAEADPANGRISDESPVGKALIGNEIGETIDVIVPDGSISQFKILDITK